MLEFDSRSKLEAAITGVDGRTRCFVEEALGFILVSGNTCCDAELAEQLAAARLILR